MKNRFYYLIFICTFSILTPIYGQTSDRIKYFIIFDVSGSVPVLDPNSNLRKLLEQFIKINQKKNSNGTYAKVINSYADFSIYFIGGSKSKVVGEQEYLSVNISKPNVSEIILDAIEKQIKSSQTQKFTYLHTALEQINQSTVGADQSGGVFVFTDGVIGDNDFEQTAGDIRFSDLAHYLDYVNGLIGKLQNLHKKPVFIIQSSLLPQNYFSIIPEQDKSSINNADLFKNSHWFWLRNNNNIVDSSKQIKNSFERFIDKANMDIVLSGSNPVKTKDSIGAVIKTQEILNLINAVKADNLSTLIAELGKPTPEVKQEIGSSLLEIITLLKLKEFTNDDIKKLQASIQQIYSAPEGLASIEKRIQNKMTLNEAAVPLLHNHRLTEAYNPTKTTDIQAIKSVKNLDSFQQLAIEGIAEYLIERTKDEAIYSFLDNVNSEFLNHQYRFREIGRFLLPNLKVAINDPQNFKDLAIIKNSFRKDIQQLPDNLIENADLFIKSEGLIALKHYYQLYKNINQTNSLEIAFSELAKSIEQNKADLVYFPGSSKPARSQLQQSILFTARLITYLKDHDISTIYQDQAKFQEISKLLIALSLNNTNVVKLEKLDEVAAIIKNIYNDYRILKDQVNSYQNILKLDPTTDYEGFKKYKGEAVVDILKQTANLMLSGAQILKHIQFTDEPITALFTPLKMIVKDATSVSSQSINKIICTFELRRDKKGVKLIFKAGDGPNQEYKLDKDFVNLVINNASFGMRIVNYDKIKDLNIALEYSIEPAEDSGALSYSKASIIKQANNCLESYFLIREEKYREAISLMIPDILLSLKERFGIDAGVLNLVTQTLQIGGEVSSAKNSQEIKNIIAAYAFPVASYKLKRGLNNTLMLNAYTGFAPYTSVYTATGQFRPAILAPIGLEFTFPILPKAKFHKSLGIMMNIIDVGNIINYKLLGEDADSGEAVNFARVFAPGIFFTYGVSHKIPMSILVGYEMNPGRASLGVAFDLPLATFWRGKIRN